MKKWRWFWMGFVLFLLWFGSTARADGEPHLLRAFWGSGGESSNLGYVLQGTAGQPSADMSSGGDFTLASGFWPGDSADVQPERQQVYLPFVLR
jgi:hypothetical protein